MTVALKSNRIEEPERIQKPHMAMVWSLSEETYEGLMAKALFHLELAVILNDRPELAR